MGPVWNLWTQYKSSLFEQIRGPSQDPAFFLNVDLNPNQVKKFRFPQNLPGTVPVPIFKFPQILSGLTAST